MSSPDWIKHISASKVYLDPLGIIQLNLDCYFRDKLGSVVYLTISFWDHLQFEWIIQPLVANIGTWVQTDH